MRTWLRRIALLLGALLVVRLVSPWICGRGAGAWYRGDLSTQRALADELVAFELRDDDTAATNRFAGEWALVTHQMIALGLAQFCLAHPEWKQRYAPIATRAALKSFRPEMRDFGTRAWHGEDALTSLRGTNGHAYLAYSALALGMARLLDPAFPADAASSHDALINAYEKRLLASTTGLIETYPNEAYPTDVAAVAAAIAVHGRATGVDHRRVLRHWADRVRAVQIDRPSGLVIQRMGAFNGRRHDAPRGSGTALAAYFAGFADRSIAQLLASGVFAQEGTFFGFGGIREYAPGHSGSGDIDSGPVVLGISVSATGFALASARAHGNYAAFERLYRTTSLFGAPLAGGSGRFVTGGPIGNALLLALLTSGPELAS